MGLFQAKCPALKQQIEKQANKKTPPVVKKHMGKVINFFTKEKHSS